MKRVLLIEDDPWLADSYAHSLASRQYQVEVVNDPDLAISALDDTPPDAVVADVMLGASNVLALLHELQSYEDTAGIPVILCSSLSLDEHFKSGSLSSYGVREVLDKQSLTPEKLASTVELALKEAGA